MSARYAFFYLMHDASGISETVPEHVRHWRGLGLDDYTGGPFDDRSGRLITFWANDTSCAQRAVAADPFVPRGLLDAYWLKHWKPQ